MGIVPAGISSVHLGPSYLSKMQMIVVGKAGGLISPSYMMTSTTPLVPFVRPAIGQ